MAARSVVRTVLRILLSLVAAFTAFALSFAVLPELLLHVGISVFEPCADLMIVLCVRQVTTWWLGVSLVVAMLTGSAALLLPRRRG